MQTMNGYVYVKLRTRAARCLIWFVSLVAAGIVSRGAESIPAPPPNGLDVRDLADLPLEQLMEVRVVSVSKKEETLARAAAAVHVITQDEIRRSGFTSIPELLRLAPGLQVGRVDSHQWAISARGFNDIFANKLLVMIDGRSIYTPLFSGVFWDVQDTFLSDIEQIEIIRGPGATLWGANAVNGVINVVTKPARETQGLIVRGGAGTEERAFGSIRYGGQLSSNAFYRVYTKYFNRDESVLPNGSDANDQWQMARTGFRVDWDASDETLLTFQGDVYAGELHQTYVRLTPVAPYSPFLDRDRADVQGGNLLGRWTRRLSSDSELSVQSYYDRTSRDSAIFKENRDTLDVDIQHRFSAGERQEIIWGGNYRATSDDVRNTFDVSLDPHDRTTRHLAGAFVQDEIEMLVDRLYLTFGSKFEHNEFTGFELQPSGRIAWTPGAKQMFWGSVARAVRTPSRAEHDLRLNQAPIFPPGLFFGPNALAPAGSPVAVTSLFGSDDFGSEELTAYEIGYRVQPHARFAVDLALFYNDYDELRVVRPGVPEFRFAESHPGVPPAHISRIADNGMEGETYGGEIAATFRATDWWRVQATYSYLQMQMHADPGVDGASELALEGASPHHQVGIRSYMDLGEDWRLNLGWRYVDTLPALGVPSYLVMDARVAWTPTPNLELAIVGLNLWDDRHPEFVPTTIRTEQTEVQHSVYGVVTWRF